MKKIISVIIILLVIVAIGLLEFSKTKVSDTKIVKEELTVLDTIPTNNSPKSVSTQDSLKINQTKTMVKPKTLTISDKKRIENKSKDYKKAIELVSPDGYINVDNITIKELIGKKVILVDFWTYSCVNCQRTLPFLTRWYDKYEGEGLEIIGVHTPEFKFEQDYNNVLRATQKWNVKYPVVQDNSYKTWQAYENRYWPRKYIIDIDGFIVYDHIGEGAYEETEKKIQELLKERAKVLNQKD